MQRSLDGWRDALRRASPPRGAVAIVGFPFDARSSHLRGASQGPEAIRGELYSDASSLQTESGVDLARPATLFDSGEVELPDPDIAGSAMRQAVAELLDRDLHPLILGGDHSITFPIVEAFVDRFGTIDLLQLDAHPDLYDSFLGDRLSHACGFARIAEAGFVERLVQIGIRNTNPHQREQALRFGVDSRGPEVRDGEPLRFERPVYVSIDLDVLDPAFAPGVAHREAGGLSTRDVLRVIRSVEGQVVGGDIVELLPARDPGQITAAAAAKLVKELAGRILAR